MIKKTLITQDDIPLRYGVNELDNSKPWLMLIMPFGFKLNLSVPFFDFFGSHYNLVTWESRLILDSMDKEYLNNEFSVKHHVNDMSAVADACQIESATLIGYCSGAGIALLASINHPHLFNRLMLVHGEYTLLDKRKCTTQFGEDMDSILSLAARGKEQAIEVFEKINASKIEKSNSILRDVDEPFSQLIYFQRLAKNYVSYKSTNFEYLASCVRHESFLQTGKKDLHCNVESTKEIGNLIPGSQLSITANSDHYGMIQKNSETMISIWNQLCAS